MPDPDGQPSDSRSLAGRYALEGQLGAGGMSIVSRARDLRHGRTVAVEMLRPDRGRQLPVADAVRIVVLAAVAAPRPGHAQISAVLHTASKPQAVRPADGERRIRRDGRAIRLEVAPTVTGAGSTTRGAHHGRPKDRPELRAVRPETGQAHGGTRQSCHGAAGKHDHRQSEPREGGGR
jgi:hypothetical protein